VRMHNDDDVRLGVLLPTGLAQWGDGTDPRQLIDFAVRAERSGYDSVWVNDSIVSPRIEALTMLAAVSAVTNRVALGTAALMPVLRRPVQAAQSIASLDLLSGGRLIVTVGAGFPGRLRQPLHTVSEVPWERRFARLDDTVALWRQLWSSTGPTAFDGAGAALRRPASRSGSLSSGRPAHLAGRRIAGGAGPHRSNV
jgi:alkanesulfonate monooxygenase SsuD/methylene tetrahydromethanopterin reductase-like flavin-dependent oxidoreductase (luciferase family)